MAGLSFSSVGRGRLSICAVCTSANPKNNRTRSSALLTLPTGTILIDTSPERLRSLQERLDLRGVAGNGIQPSVLEAAGARDADMLIACASADETNLVACKVAHSQFGIPTRIARLRSAEFQQGSPLIGVDGFAVDAVIWEEEP